MSSQLDKTDLQILNILQKDATLTTKEISFQISKAVGTVHDRIRRLNDQGIIKKTVAILDRKKINRSLVAFSHVLMNNHNSETLKTFESEVIKFPEVMECFQMTGTFDFILRIETSDMDNYGEFYRDKLSKLPNIHTVQSFFVLAEIKSNTSYTLS